MYVCMYNNNNYVINGSSDDNITISCSNFRVIKTTNLVEYFQ